jgi:hypothetical protein
MHLDCTHLTDRTGVISFLFTICIIYFRTISLYTTFTILCKPSREFNPLLGVACVDERGEALGYYVVYIFGYYSIL